MTESGYHRHSSHDFPKGIRGRDRAVLLANTPGAVLAAGSRPNRKIKDLFAASEEASVDALGLENAICRGKFNRKENSNPYHKPHRLKLAIEAVFKIGQDGSVPKLKAPEIHTMLKKGRDPKDGGLMFCYAKPGTWPRKKFCNLCKQQPCDCNGMLPPVGKIQEMVTYLTQCEKKRKKKDGFDQHQEDLQALQASIQASEGENMQLLSATTYSSNLPLGLYLPPDYMTV